MSLEVLVPVQGSESAPAGTLLIAGLATGAIAFEALDRLMNQETAHSFFRRVVERARDLMSDEHFTVDGTLIEAWASQKSFQRKAGGTDGDGRHFRQTGLMTQPRRKYPWPTQFRIRSMAFR